MKKFCSESGFGLIEALVVVLVVAVGLLALGGFHGDLMSGSGLTKARGEAMMLARAKLEELTNNVTKGQFTSSVADTGVNTFSTPETIIGKNAAFSRSWQIEDIDDTVANAFKEVVVRVSWQDPKALTQQVSLNSLLSFNDPDKVGIIAEVGGGAGQGEGLNPKRSGKKGPGMESDSTLTGSATPITGIPGIPDTVFQWQFNTKGNVVLLDSANSVLYTFFGQSLQYVNGKVFYDQPNFLDESDVTCKDPLNPAGPPVACPEIAVFASEPAYCASFPTAVVSCPDEVKAKKGDNCAIGAYVCFFSGDCEHGDVAGDGDLGHGLDCSNFIPAGIEDPYADVYGLDGGWYGKVGIARKNTTDLRKKTVCQADIDDSNSTNSSSREYIAVRTFASGDKKYEGINQSFTCQNFVVAEMTDELNTCNALVNSFSLLAPDVGLPSSKVHRYLGESDPNQVQYLNEFWCDAVNIVGKRPTSSSLLVVDASVSGDTTTPPWPEDECVGWPDQQGFSCSVTPGTWSGTISVQVQNGAGATCTQPVAYTPASPPKQSTRLSDLTLCTP
jgi:Tfp pilus assembly protein PilV